MIVRHQEIVLPGPISTGFPELADLLKVASRRIPEILDHCTRVARIASPLADALALNAAERNLLLLSAYLHDVGKLFIPPSLLFKPAPFTQAERSAMDQHPILGEATLRAHGMPRISTIVGQHHERVDGTGYPNGIAGDDIDPLAKAISIVDAFVAMVESRPYQPTLTVPQARREIQRCSGTQFDMQIARVFLDLNILDHAVAC